MSAPGPDDELTPEEQADAAALAKGRGEEANAPPKVVVRRTAHDRHFEVWKAATTPMTETKTAAQYLPADHGLPGYETEEDDGKPEPWPFSWVPVTARRSEYPECNAVAYSWEHEEFYRLAVFVAGDLSYPACSTISSTPGHRATALGHYLGMLKEQMDERAKRQPSVP